MNTDKNYGGVIWTNHAIERMNQRGVKQGDAWATWKRPDSSRYNKNKDVWVYQRNFSGEEIEVVAKPPVRRTSGPEEKKWLILSVWSKKVGGYDQKKSTSWLQLIKSLFFPKK